jgi:autotransporter-associated beta strand protein
VTIAQRLVAGSASTGGLTKNGNGTLALAAPANTYNGPTNVTAGTLVIADTGTRNNVLKGGALTIAPGARLDIKNNKLITNSPIGSFNGTAYTGIQGEVARAYDFGSWDLPGLMTSMPDAGPTIGTTTIGLSTGEAVLFIAPTQTGTFAGQTVTGASTIAMYTYAGDVNFDGLVDASDYGIIDNYYQFAARPVMPTAISTTTGSSMPATTASSTTRFNYKARRSRCRGQRIERRERGLRAT